MNKSALKNFATNARRELLKKVEARAMKIGITEDNIKKAEIESSDAIFIDGRQLSKEEKTQRDRLVDRINQIGFKRVMEEVAYTWFNRFTALRFMEVNDYLPTKVRVLSSAYSDSTEPDMMKEALSLDLEIDKEYVYELKMNNKSEELFKYLIIKHCNDLNRYMPFMFEKIDDYTEILFPDGLLATDSFIRHMINTEEIPENNWNKVEVIGWLYQFYIAEEKDRVFKAKKKYKAEEIPYATQLFTPDWIVRYMVQNSLGRFWTESHPDDRELIKNWELYLENPMSEENLKGKIAHHLNNKLKVEEIKCFDPAMGSGHILVYMFDVLYEIYSKCGYMEREIPRLIIENNLYGLDIDDRAFQLACFSLVMKAMEYNPRFFRNIEREKLKINLASIQETNMLNEEDIIYISLEPRGEYYNKTKKFMEQFYSAKTYGSLLRIQEMDFEFFKERLSFILENPGGDLFEESIRNKVLMLLPELLKQAKIMSNRYDVLVTNPPYMGIRHMNEDLSKFLKKHYPDSMGDTFASFMELKYYLKPNGFLSMINQHSWMFLSMYEKLRGKIIGENSISSMLHLGTRAFEDIGGEVVQTTAFVLRNYLIDNYIGEYVRLVEFNSSNEKQIKALEAVNNSNVEYRYSFNNNLLHEIPGNPIVYWLHDKVRSVFKNPTFYEYSISDGQNVTGNNERFVRFHWELDKDKIGKGKKWLLYAKGGGYRKWSGNLENVVDWSEKARSHYKKDKICRIIPEYLWYKKGITWGLITSSPSFRLLPEDSTFDKGGSSIFLKNYDLYNYFLGLLNSKVFIYIANTLNPTLNFQVKDVRSMPVIIPCQDLLESVNTLVVENIQISGNDWDSFETSFNFKKHPLLFQKGESLSIQEAFDNWNEFSKRQLFRIKRNEEKLNEIFIQIYNLKDVPDIVPNVTDDEVTVRSSDKEFDVKTFISYSVGCIFGRYSLDKEGLVYAGGKFDHSQYKTFPADKDNVLPILPGAYFEDDIVSRLVDFVRITFGEDTLNENLDFVADALGRKKGETAKETLRRYFLNDFYKDHVKTYGKRPIYWLFTSGKEKAFNCLIYMHRYDKTTLSRIRTDYLHDYQIRLDAEKKDLLDIIDGDSTTKEISNAKKELKSLEKKIDELKAYDELLHHMADRQIEIDLDDGVKANYEMFKGLVAKI